MIYKNGCTKSNIGHFDKIFLYRTLQLLRSYLASEGQKRLKPINNCFKHLFRSHLLHCLHILLHLCPFKHVLGYYQ
jgi:hypothetical protein